MKLLEKTKDGLRSLVSATKARLPKTRRGRILFFGAAVVVAICFVGGLSVAVWSSYPSFCPSCHHIEPYYDSWAVSVHGREHVGCTQCHFTPGLGPYIMGKVNGLVEVVKYFAGAVPVKLRSEVQDVSCLREGCHSIDELKAETVEFGDVRFDHDVHLGASRGLKLRCASCHSTSLHSEDETVSKRGCFTCHFMPGRADETVAEREAREKLGKCDTCHETPKEVTTHVGVKLDHEKYAGTDDECARCHVHVTQGEGAIAKERCLICHNEGLGHLEKYGETESVHETHVTDHQVACFECHDEISHGVTGSIAFQAGSSRSFLVGTHHAVEKLYAGSRGAGVEGVPDAMFAAEVQCTGCHVSGSGQAAGRREVSPFKACVDCHEAGYDKMAARWKLAFEGYVSELEAARERAASLEKPGSEAKELLAQATRNIELVHDGHAVHNVRWAARCLREAQSDIARVLGPAGLEKAAAVLPTHEADAARCLDMCHLGLETVQTLAYADKDFPHDRHVLDPKASCSQCHSFDEKRHGETHTATASDCNACHHKEEKDCESCHPVQKAMYFAAAVRDIHAQPTKMAEKEVACVSCHEGVSRGHSRETVRRLCQECHKGQKARGKMLDDWQAGIREELAEVEGLIRRAKALLADRTGLSRKRAAVLREALAKSLKAAERVRRDGSYGAHNLEYVYAILSDAGGELLEALIAAE